MPEDWLRGRGETGRVIRSIDWSKMVSSSDGIIEATMISRIPTAPVGRGGSEAVALARLRGVVDGT
jgi:hypothetical protein